MPSYSRVVRIALVLAPALAVAAPKKHKKTTQPPPPTHSEGSGSGSDTGSDATDATGSAAPNTAPSMPAEMGSGAGSAEPAKVEPPIKDTASANEPDVDSLRQEYLSLRDELFKSRARANAVASALYSTRIQIRFTWTSGRYYGVSKAQIRLDGATVFEDAGNTIAGDDGVRFDGYVAPGRHLITFHVDASGKDDDAFTSSTESQIVVKAVAQKDLIVAAKARDSGDIAYTWKKSEHGSYGLGIDIAVKALTPVAPDTKGSKK